ncbi:CpaD family pilus assembly protein [Qipengyuania gaetbuli]|uniref:CpaD family pilus assembly protein n=1 Tax=Qipengyuania gaetbuli TaxID=266952 RepID=UPI002D7F7D9E|nr:CpaD family pilus assembly protein [Qipengyuania gaetbuli]
MTNAINRKLTASIAASLALALGACGSSNMENRTLYSVKQPVVERSNFVLDVNTNADGLPVSEQQRLAEWFESMDLRYGDRVAIEDATGSAAVREDVAVLAGRYGLLLAEGVPVTAGYAQPGQARVVITRSTASVPGCPDWSHTAEGNDGNATNPNYGCAVNSNLAAMVANPEDLIRGQQGSGETVVTTSTKAIKAYREMEPTGKGGLPEVSTTEGD